MAISQKQIADALNLSIITVSRALRNHPYLSDETRARVLDKAKELGYAKTRPNPVEEAVKPRRAGVIFYEAPSQIKISFASRMKSHIFYALQKECQRLQVETLIETVELDEVPMLVSNRTIDVAFVFGRYTPESLARLGDIPTLAVSSFIAAPGLSRIVADNVRGMQEATEHLISLGHKKILFVGSEDPHTRLFRERAQGYLIAMHEHGLEPVMQYFRNYQVPAENLEGYTGFACASDALAYEVQHQLGGKGLRLPEDRSVVGFDNLAHEYPLERNKITTYGPDWELMGRTAADLLLSEPLKVHNQGLTVTVPGKMYLYDSTAAPAAS